MWSVSKRGKTNENSHFPLLSSLFSVASFYHEGHYAGFYFFEDAENGKRKEEKPRDYAAIIDPDEADQITRANEEALRKAVNLATLNPTPDHILTVLKLQGALLDRSLAFSNKVRQTLLDHPNLGAVFDTPMSQYGINIKKAATKAEKDELLKNLSHHYFLLLFVSGEDPYSEAAVNIAKFVQSIYGWEIRVVSTNGKPIANFPNWQQSGNLSAVFGVNKTPVFFIVNPTSLKKGKSLSFEQYPVGAGVISFAELVNNICLQASHHKLVETLQKENNT